MRSPRMYDTQKNQVPFREIIELMKEDPQTPAVEYPDNQ